MIANLVIQLLCIGVSLGNQFQPKVTTVEKNPSRKVFGSVLLPEGSPWCDGLPTYWLVGHQPSDETPWCQNATTGDWEMHHVAVLDSNDALNDLDGPKHIDRHDCASMDVNRDGLIDIICIVGANKGTGYGYNEVYLTQADGSLVKIPDGHGLQKYTTMRTRFIRTLTGADGSQFVFIASRGVPRTDGEPNTHRMFRNVWNGDDTAPLFEEVENGPWIQYTEAECVVVADVNGDSLDDLIVCNRKKEALLFVQHANSTWSNVQLNGRRAMKWENVRVADVTYDGVPDLLVVSIGPTGHHYLRIIEGSKEAPFFDLTSVKTQYKLPFAAPDLEVLDVNDDGLFDIYLVQTDTSTSGTYCAGKLVHSEWWEKGNQPPPSFVPPEDEAHDILLVGRPAEPGRKPFEKVLMQHSEPGCGARAERFGDSRTLVLAQGDTGHPGHNLLLQW